MLDVSPGPWQVLPSTSDLRHLISTSFILHPEKLLLRHFMWPCMWTADSAAQPGRAGVGQASKNERDLCMLWSDENLD